MRLLTGDRGAPIEAVHDGDATVVVVAGELDLYSTPVVRERILALVAEAEAAVVLDLTSVTFLDSTGIALVIATRDRAMARDVTFAIRPSPTVRKVLELVGLGRYLRT